MLGIPRNLFAILVISLAVFVGKPVHAADQVDICARYAASGRAFRTAAYNTDGTELNRATYSRNYEPFDHFIVIPQGADNFVIIKMPDDFYAPGFYPRRGIDQLGRAWDILYYAPDAC
jgi:hypothetical protein